MEVSPASPKETNDKSINNVICHSCPFLLPREPFQFNIPPKSSSNPTENILYYRDFHIGKIF